MINKSQLLNSTELDGRGRVRGPNAAGSLLFKLGPLKFNGRLTKSLLTSLSAFFALRSYQFTITVRRARAFALRLSLWSVLINRHQLRGELHNVLVGPSGVK